MNKSVVICSVLARPSWGSHPMSKRDSTKICKVFEDHKVKASMGSFRIGYANESDMGSQNMNDNEEFLLEDLSQFSNEDIAAHIESEYDNTLQQHSDIKSDCTTGSASTSNILQHCEQNLKTALLGHDIEHPSKLSLPDQDETGFEWLGSLADDNLVYSAVSNFDIDSFLLSMPMPFSGTLDGILKHTDYENAILEEQEMESGQNLARNTCGVAPESEQAELETYSRADSHLLSLQTCNIAELTAPIITSSRSARSKRTRTVSGWSSAGGILWQPWPESPSPTRSLQSSSSQVTDEIKKGLAPQYTGCTVGVMSNQEEGYSTSLPDFRVEIEFDGSPNGKPNGDNFRKVGSLENCLNDEGCTREENASSSHGGGALQQPRRCTHCLSQKTPQWRAGPMGPKTLCNACGVRYKSGRLCEEYRPAKSPTFLSYKHSNSHKKVMDMRRRKAFRCTQQQHMPLLHRVQASPMMQTDTGDRPTIANAKARLHNPAVVDFPVAAHFSDVTLIRTRNAFESPSNFLY